MVIKNHKESLSSPTKKKTGSRGQDTSITQTSLSSFFKRPQDAASSIGGAGPSTSASKAKQGNKKQTLSNDKGAKGEHAIGKGIISIDESSDEEMDVRAKKHANLVLNNLLPATSDELVGTATYKEEIITLSDSEPDEKPTLTAAKRKNRSSSSSLSPEPKTRALNRASTPPPLLQGTAQPPLTPSKMLKLTAPLNPSPSKRVKRENKLNPKSEPETLEFKPVHPAFALAAPQLQQAERLDFDQDMFMFRPQDVSTTGWPGGKLPYEVLVGVYLQVGGTRSRLAIVRIITNFLRTLIYHCPADLLPTIYLLSNHLKPSYVPLELGIGSQVLNNAVKDVSGVGRDVLKRLWDKWGDPGDVAFEAKSNLRTLIAPTPLSVQSLYAQLLKIANTKGSGSAKVKGDIVKKLLVQTKGEEVRYLVRTLVRHLRIGAVRLTLLSSLARAFVLTQPGSGKAFSPTLHATTDELLAVRPIPIKGAGKGKGKGKAKEEPDEMREHLERKCVHGVALLRKIYVRHPNYDDILAALMLNGLEGIEEKVPLSVGIPLSPMLGSITRSLNEVYTRLGSLPFTAEAKLDGQRVQIHARTDGPSGTDDGGGRWVEPKNDGRRVWVRLFSRHLEDMTEKYPDILGLISALVNRPLNDASPFPEEAHLTTPDKSMLDLLAADRIDSFVIDAEVVALDKETAAFRTFQDLSNRAKKDVKVEDIKVIVGVFSFDLMLLNDQPLLNQPFSIRRHLLRTIFKPLFESNDITIARFSHVESIDSTRPEDVQAFFEQVVSQKCEGLMVKLLESGEGLTGDDAEDDEDTLPNPTSTKEKAKSGGRKKPLPSTYEPDARSQGWLKVKKDYLEGVGDTLDLIPIGAWHGLGRKAGWWSPILLAAYNPDTGALEAVCKCLAGFTDVFYKALLVKYPPSGKPEMARKGEPYAYCETGGLRPDIWFKPQEVWQMAAADITSSPVYTAGASYLGSERGVSLRFPRFISVRDDKGIEEATSAEQLADMYRQQIAAAPSKVQTRLQDEHDGTDEF